MTISLSNLVNNLSEEIHKIRCIYGHDNKKCARCGLKYKNYNCFLQYMFMLQQKLSTRG